MKTKTFNNLAAACNYICLLLIIDTADIFITTKLDFQISAQVLIGYIAFMFYYLLVKRFTKNIYLFTIGHIIPCIVVSKLTLADLTLAKYIIFLIAVSFANYKFWFGKQRRYISEISPGLGAFILISYLLTYSADSTVTNTLFVFILIFIILCMFKTFFSNAYNLAHTGQLSDNMPVAAIFKNSFLSAFILCTIAFFAILFARIDSLATFVNNILSYIGNFFWQYIKKILMKIFTNKDTAESVVHTSNSQKGGYPDATVTHSELFEKISNTVLALFVIGLFLYGTIMLIKFIKENRTKKIKDIKNNTFADSYEIHESLRKKSSRNRIFLSKDNNEKIRAIYQKKLKSLKRKGVSVYNTNTPLENALNANKQSGEDISSPTNLYEKIRYNADYDASSKDVEEMKSLINHH